MVRVENVERPVLLESVVVRRVEKVQVVLEQLTNHLIVIVVFNYVCLLLRKFGDNMCNE